MTEGGDGLAVETERDCILFLGLGEGRRARQMFQVQMTPDLFFFFLLIFLDRRISKFEIEYDIPRKQNFLYNFFKTIEENQCKSRFGSKDKN